MSDNRIISTSRYVVSSVSSTDIENRIIKRPYNNSQNPSHKKQDSSDKKKKSSTNSNNAVNSVTPQSSSADDKRTFSNELENMVRLKNEENSRLVQTKFNNTLNNAMTKANTTDNELHNKLRQAMNDLEVKVDVSELYKKLQLIEALKQNSNEDR